MTQPQTQSQFRPVTRVLDHRRAIAAVVIAIALLAFANLTSATADTAPPNPVGYVDPMDRGLPW
jgi:hypothetical protein